MRAPTSFERTLSNIDAPWAPGRFLGDDLHAVNSDQYAEFDPTANKTADIIYKAAPWLRKD